MVGTGKARFIALALDEHGRQSVHAARRLQLRIEPDGAGVLWIDAFEAIHLNPAAAFLAAEALRGASQRAAAARLHRAFRGVPAAERSRAAAQVYDLVAKLKTSASACSLCGLEELTRRPLFSAAPSAPYKADLALTYACNNACGHCYNPPQRRGMRGLDAKGFRAVLRTLRAIGVPHVVFTGGEPTSCDALADLIACGAKLGLATGLNTNGRRLAEPGYAAALRQAGLDHVQITLESRDRGVHDAMTGARSFDETVAGVHAALDAGLHTMTNTTLTADNVAGAVDLVDFLHALGLRTFAMNGMIHAGCGAGNPQALAPERLAPLLDAVRRRAAELRMRFLWYTPTQYCRLSPLALELGPRRCSAGEYSICIEPNGDVLPCQSYYEPAGNLLAQPWEAIWNGPLLRRFRGRTADPAGFGLPAECCGCLDLEICGGGCPLERRAAKLQGGLPACV